MSELRRAAAIGGGVIGAGWIARLTLNGVDVAVFDPDAEASRKVGEVLANAERAWGKLTLAPLPRRGAIRYAASLADAVADAELVQESAPERVDLKRRVLAEIDAHAPADALVGSSTSGLLPSELQAGMKRPGRFFVAHPFNPVYLIPLVELVGGRASDDDALARAAEVYAALGMKPVRVRREIEAFVGDRLLEAFWREALWLVKDDVATVEEIDDVVRYGFGLRWAQMGTFLIYRIAGGEAGMRHFMAQFGPALKWPWTKLTDVPELDDALLDKLVAQSDAQAGGLGIRELERIRDDNLVAILQALRTQRDGRGWGAGALLRDFEARLLARAHGGPADARPPDLTRPLRLLETAVRPDWVDYNNHMTESRYLQVFGDATDALLGFVGFDDAYRAGAGSFYTVETHIVHRREIAGLEPLYATTQLLGADAKRIHVFHRLHHARDDALLASAEQLLVHVDARTRKAAPAVAPLATRLAEIAAAHAALPRPDEAGRAVAMRR